VIYLASPYSKFTEGHTAAFLDAAMLTGKLIKRGFDVFSPIVHGNPLAIYGGVPQFDAALWERVNRPYLEWCDELYVATMPGWQESAGVAHEIKYFADNGLPIANVDPVTLQITPVRNLSEVV
jgi:hypothetical protein